MKGGAIGAATLDGEGANFAELSRPLKKRGITICRGRREQLTQPNSAAVESYRDVLVFMGIDADDNFGPSGRDACHVDLLCQGQRTRPRPGGEDRTVMGPSAIRLLLGHCPPGRGRLLRVHRLADRHVNARTRGRSLLGSGRPERCSTIITVIDRGRSGTAEPDRRARCRRATTGISDRSNHRDTLGRGQSTN